MVVLLNFSGISKGLGFQRDVYGSLSDFYGISMVVL